MVRSCALCFFALLSVAVCYQNGDVRLEDVTDPTRGRVEVYDDGNWISICYDYQSVTAQRGVGQAICRQMGYYDLSEVGNVTTFKLPTNGTNATEVEKMTNGDCPYDSNPMNALQHVYRCTFGGGQCSDGDNMAVDCVDDARLLHPYDTMVDFLNDDAPSPDSQSDGFAQVYLNGEWGPVCNMQQEDADAFCRQLSYTGAESVLDFEDDQPNYALVDKFHCDSDSNAACLRKCFDYPRKDAVGDCPNGHSYVTCEYDRDGPDGLFGTKSFCAASKHGSSNGGVVAAVVICVLLAVATAVIIGVVVFYFYRKNKGTFTPSPLSSSKTKYDAI